MSKPVTKKKPSKPKRQLSEAVRIIRIAARVQKQNLWRSFPAESPRHGSIRMTELANG